MGRPAKILAWVIAAILAVFALAAIALTFFVDPNDFREDIASAVQDSTGRELRIDGDISVQLFPWLAVQVGHAALGNAEGFGDEPFAEFDEARLSVRLLPLLLRQEADIGTAEIAGLRLRLAVDSRGRANWDDLLEADNGEETTDTGGASSLDISGVGISDASISYMNAQTGDRYELTDVNLSVGRVSSAAEPIPLEGSLRFDVQPSDLSGSIEIDTVVAFDNESGVFTLDGFLVEGQVEGLVEGPTRMRFETAAMEINSAENMVSVDPVTLSLLDLEISADVEPFSYDDDIKPTAQIRVEPFSPRSLMHLFDVEPPETADPNVLSNVSIVAKAYVRENNISMTGLTIQLDDTTFKGSMTVPTDGASRFLVNLSADALDLNRYMAPPSSEGGEAPDASSSAPVEIPADLIKPLKARGDLKIETLLLGGLQLDQVVLSLNAADGRLRIHPIAAALYGGSYNGDVSVDVTSARPVLSMNETVQGVDLAKLARAMFEQDNITGTINGNFKLSGRGNDLNEVQASLGGTMNFALKDGTYEGTDVWYELRRARAVLKKETPPEPVLPARTKFSSVTATGVVTDGIMRNNDLVADLPFMQLTGSGDVNIPDGTVDYSLKARVFEKPEALEAATPEEIEDFTKTVVPLKITGPLSDPKVRPDVEALLRQRVEEELEDVVKDKLKDLFKR